MKTILITGGAGFIGSNVVRYLYTKYPEYKFLILDALTYAGNLENFPKEIRDSDRFQFWYGDINSFELINDLAELSDIVVHFAAETHVARSLYLSRVFFVTDVLGTQSVMNAILNHAEKVERFIHISTSEVYGTAKYEPMDEDHPLEPLTPYASAKAGADRLVSSYIASYDLPGVIIRPFNNYGPCQHLEKVVPRFITGAILNEPLYIHGDGSAARDWVYVDDTADAIDRAIHAPLDDVKGQIINVGSGKSVSIIEIAHMVLDAFSKKREWIHFMEDRLGQVHLHVSSTKKAEEIMGFHTQVIFEQGLEKTIKWYKENQEQWKRQVHLKKVPVKTKTGKIVWY
jgi:dTDP-glucose 4,6-dehydratase